MSPQLARTTLIPQPTSSTQEDNHSTETIRRQRPNSELDEHYRKHQHTHMHTPTFTSAPAGPAHLSARPQATSRRTLRTNSGELQLVGAASSRPPGSARLPAHRRRRAPRSNSTQDEASRRTRSAARTACRSQFIISIALVATLALVLSGAGPRVAEAEAKPVSGQQQYQLVQFRRLPPKQFSAALGSSIIIECEAGAAPPPAIHWLRNGARIHQVSGGRQDARLL